jgi:hypothetical protein
MIAGGIAMVGFSAVALTIAALRGLPPDAGFLSSLGVLATGGAAMFGIGALRLPRWARLRQRQMEDVAARVAAVTSSEKASPAHLPD